MLTSNHLELQDKDIKELIYILLKILDNLLSEPNFYYNFNMFMIQLQIHHHVFILLIYHTYINY